MKKLLSTSAALLLLSAGPADAGFKRGITDALKKVSEQMDGASKKAKKKQQPSVRTTDPKTGVTTKVEGQPDGSRVITRTDKHGRIISTKRVKK